VQPAVSLRDCWRRAALEPDSQASSSIPDKAAVRSPRVSGAQILPQSMLCPVQMRALHVMRAACLCPEWPSLFITDITDNPNDRSGDWQQGGKPYGPSGIYGTWKAAVSTVDNTVSPAMSTIIADADPAKNNWDLGNGADEPPISITKNEGFSAEVVWDMTFTQGHRYRIQVIFHNDDRSKPGPNAGEACLDFCAITDH